jgi:hypothetical protein
LITKRRFCTLGLSALLPAAFAQQWPSRPLILLAAGGPRDAAGRVATRLAPALAKALGQRVEVRHRPEAAGQVAVADAAAASPDGYTLLLADVETFAKREDGPEPLAALAPVELVARVDGHAWVGLFIPKGGPSPLVERLAEACTRPGTLQSLSAPGIEARGGDAAELSRRLHEALTGHAG